MKNKSGFVDSLNEGRNVFLPNVSVDCVILTFCSRHVKVLLCKFGKDQEWRLPGGFVRRDEDLDDSAYRILEERTGMKDVYLRQFNCFGAKNRIDIEENASVLKQIEVVAESAKWYLDRFISIGYYSLIKYNKAQLIADEDEDLEWFDINNIPDLYGDHKEIVNTAFITLRKQVGFLPLGYKLLPEKFTMPELRSIYETLLERELDRRNFQRKMLSVGYIVPLNETRKDGAHKSPNLYAFVKEKYEEAEKYGLQLMSNNL